MIIPNIWENKIHVPNHQPVTIPLPPNFPNFPKVPVFALAQGLLGRHHLDAQHDLLDLRADDPTAEDREEIRQDLAVRAVR